MSKYTPVKKDINKFIEEYNECMKDEDYIKNTKKEQIVIDFMSGMKDI